MTGRGGSHDRADSGEQPPKLLPDGGVQTADDSSGFELFECELDWTHDVHLETGPVEVQLQKEVKATNAPDIDYLAGALRFEGEVPDSRARWHHNYTPIDRWIRAHIYREARGFSIQEVVKYLNETPSTALWMGFWEKPSNHPDHANPPKYTQLRDMWEEQFLPRTRGAAGRDSIPKSEQRHAAARMVRKYGRRWGIENDTRSSATSSPGWGARTTSCGSSTSRSRRRSTTAGGWSISS